MDTEDIAPGQVFTESIQRTLANCEAVLVVIGPRWRELLLQRGAGGQPDYVLLEVEAALERKLRVVPVLVGGATAAQLSALPGALAPLAYYHAAELRDSSFKEDCARLADGLGGSRPRRRLWIGAAVAAVAAVAVIAVIAGGVSYRGRDPVVTSLIETAKSQSSRGEHQSAFRTLQKALATEPSDNAILEAQADAAMGWLRDFRVVVPEGGKAGEVAGPLLTDLIATLDAALARTDRQSSRAADILAHLGWAHWLNQKMAYREFGPAAERDLRQSLQLEPGNVFAHAMLGNLLLQRRSSPDEALKHFEAAVRTGRERLFVRRMQLGAMIYDDAPAVRQALIRAVNEMRKSGEPLEDSYKRRVLTAYSPTVNDRESLRITVAALPPDDAWATFLWLSDPRQPGVDPAAQKIQSEFIQATILEISGRTDEALAAFSSLRSELRQHGYTGRILTHVSEAITSLQR